MNQTFQPILKSNTTQQTRIQDKSADSDDKFKYTLNFNQYQYQESESRSKQNQSRVTDKKGINDDIHQDLKKFTQEVKKDFKNIFNTSGFDKDSIESSQKDSKHKTFNTARLSPKSNAQKDLRLPSLTSRRQQQETQLNFDTKINTMRNAGTELNTTVLNSKASSQFNETLNNINQIQAKISYNQFDTSIIEPERHQPATVLSNLNAQHLKIKKNIKKLANKSKQKSKESSRDTSPKDSIQPSQSKKKVSNQANQMNHPSIRQYSQKQLMALKEEQEKRIMKGHSTDAFNENSTADLNNTNSRSLANHDPGIDASMIHLRVIQFSDSGDSRSSSEHVHHSKRQKFINHKTLQGRGYIKRNDGPLINKQMFDPEQEGQPIQNIVIKNSNRKRVNNTPFIKELQSNQINLPGLNTVNDFVNAQSSRDLNYVKNVDSLQSLVSSQEGTQNTGSHFKQRHNSHMINTQGPINTNNRAHITSIQYLNQSASRRTMVESLGQDSYNLQTSSRGDLTKNFLKQNKSLTHQGSSNKITNQELDSCVKRISKIHSKLMEKRDTQFSTQNMMTQLESLIPQRSIQQLKQMKMTSPSRYLDKTDLSVKTPTLITNKGIFKLLTPLEKLNQLSNNVLLPELTSIRASLCGPLQELIECYNSLFLFQFQEFAKYSVDKDQRIDQFVAEMQEYHDAVTEEKQRLEQWKDNVDVIIQGREKDCKISEEQLKSLEEEVKKLRKVIESGETIKEEQKNEILEKQQEAQKSLETKVNMEDKYEARKRQQLQRADYADSAKHIYDQTNIPQLKESMKLAQKSFDIRDSLLTDIDGLIKNMIMSRAKQSVKCQTDEAVWNSLPNIIKYEYEQFEESDLSEDEKQHNIAMAVGEINAVQQYKEDQIEIRKESKYRDLKVKHGILKPSLIQTQDSQEDFAEESDERGQQLNQKLPLKKKKTSKLPIQTPQGFDELKDPEHSYSMSLRQQGFISVNQMNQKHEFLINMLRKTKYVINKKENNPLDQKGGVTLKQPSGIIEWVIPYPIITFCANHIGNLQEMQEELGEQKFYDKLSDLLVPWTRFKQMIFQIYNERISASAELNGATNNTYCHMGEFLLVFFIDRLKIRSKAEEECIILILNLYYYFDLWHRARNMVYNLQLVKIETSQQRFDRQKKALDQSKDKYGDLDYMDVSHGHLRDNNVPDNDIYTQEFFLMSYNLITRGTELIESQEGNTYISYNDHNPPVRKILTKFRGVEKNNKRMNDWTKRIEPLIFKFSVKEGEEARDFLDLDVVLQELMFEYKDTRALFQKQTKEYFVDHCQAMEAILDYGEFQNLIQNQTSLWGESEMVDGLIRFPSKFQSIRAFVYAATACRTNQVDIHVDNFLASLSRFGLENPIPTVTHRIAYFGVHDDVVTLVKKAKQKLQNEKKRTFMHKGTSKVIEDERGIEFDVDTFLGEKQEAQFPLGKRHALKKSRYSEIYQNLQVRDQVDAQETKGSSPLRHDSEAQIKKTSQKELGSEDKRTFFLAGNCNFKIEDIKQVEVEDYDYLDKQRESPTARAAMLRKSGSAKSSVSMDSLYLKKQVNSAPPKKVEKEAKTIIQPMTGQNKIVVPSFQTTGKIFAAHLEILRDIRKQTKMLRQAYFRQMDKDRSWQQVDQILLILKNGEQFLDETISSNIEDMQNDMPQVKDILDEIQKKQQKSNLRRIKSNDMKGGSTPTKTDLQEIEEVPDENYESPRHSPTRTERHVDNVNLMEIKSQD